MIVGAGIIGVCTAYYITRHPLFDASKHHVSIIEARRVAGGASGKAGGLLALWAFPQQIVPLSFNLHQELANEYNGEQEWGYRRVNTVGVDGDIQQQSTSTKKLRLPKDLDWLRPEVLHEWSTLGGPDTTAQVHPYKFTNFLLKKTLESDGVDLIIGKVTKIETDPEDGTAIGVEYTPKDQDAPVKLTGDHIVLTLGPWTSKILPSCPISGLRAHSITISPTRQLSANALFTELRVSRTKIVSPEVYPRKDEVYVCGEGDTLAPVPESTDDVEVVKEKCDELFKYASAISEQLQDGRILRRQACYLPIVDKPSYTGPFIGETNIHGLYLASGHSCWGINNAPGTGKVMSEIILEGRAKSARLDGLEADSFDACLD